MKCPYCNNEMEKGIIESQREINWKSGEKKHFIRNAAIFHKDAVVLSKAAIDGSAVVGYLCRECQKIIIDFSDYKSDLNYCYNNTFQI